MRRFWHTWKLTTLFRGSVVRHARDLASFGQEPHHGRKGQRRRVHLYLIFLGALASVFVMAGCGKQPSQELVVSVAANLRPVMEALSPQIQEEIDVPVIYNYGASGKLAQQIEQGAPVDVFLSANARYVDELMQQGWLIPESEQAFAIGRLVVWTRDPAISLTDFSMLAEPEVRRIAIANPDHAPYGMAAKEALMAAGLWDRVESKLIFGEDVYQSYQFAHSGNVDVAIIPLSLVIDDATGQWIDVPATLYAPLRQVAAIVERTELSGPAEQFIQMLVSPLGQEVLRQHGYDLVERRSLQPNRATTLSRP